MPPKKIATLNLRIDPGLKEAAREAANQDHRSLANWIELLIRERCEQLGIPIPEQQALFDGEPEDSKGNSKRRTKP